MKNPFRSLRLLFTAVTFGALVSLAQAAGVGHQYWETLRTEAQFKELHAGDKVNFVCNECHTVSEMTLTSDAQAADLYKDGAAVSCPACAKKFKVVVKRSREQAPTHSEVVYVNDKGEEVAFITKASEQK